jgi:hypothetical protein
MRRKTNIFSIFGQIEGVVAEAMVAEGKCNRISPDMIPATARFDDMGRAAQCALVMNEANEREFNQRVRDLRQ